MEKIQSFNTSSASVGVVGDQSGHIHTLDGWRGLSILFVLAAHLLPLGPKSWQLNLSSGIVGMVIFFILSGFLITSFLLNDQKVLNFLIRRFFRVIPLAWLYLAITLTISGATLSAWIAHFLFYANMPPKELLHLTDHIWSLCVEVQFYVGVALIVFIAGRRGLFVLPLLGIGFTAWRAWNGVYASSVSYYRIDEILAGCSLALLYHSQYWNALKAKFAHLPLWPFVLLLIISCLPQGHWMNYARPYLAGIVVGLSIINNNDSIVRRLNNQLLVFLAGISYALYVIHPSLASTWLGSGDDYEKYAKRPLLFAVLFVLAYCSTHYYESRFMQWGRQLAKRVSKK